MRNLEFILLSALLLAVSPVEARERYGRASLPELTEDLARAADDLQRHVVPTGRRLGAVVSKILGNDSDGLYLRFRHEAQDLREAARDLESGTFREVLGTDRAQISRERRFIRQFDRVYTTSQDLDRAIGDLPHQAEARSIYYGEVRPLVRRIHRSLRTLASYDQGSRGDFDSRF